MVCMTEWSLYLNVGNMECQACKRQGVQSGTSSGTTVRRFRCSLCRFNFGFSLFPDPMTVGLMTVDPMTVDPVLVDPVTVDLVTVDPVTVDPVTVDPVTIDPLTLFQSILMSVMPVPSLLDLLDLCHVIIYPPVVIKSSCMAHMSTHVSISPSAYCLYCVCVCVFTRPSVSYQHPGAAGTGCVH